MRKFGVIGFGRFGSLLAGILRHHGLVRVYDTVNKRKMAEDMGVIFSSLDEAASQEILIVSVPISQFEETLRKVAPHLAPGTLVMDTCSVKELPAQWMEKHLPDYVEILATHPLFGPDSAKYGLYGLQIVFCPVRISASHLEDISHLFRSTGLEVLVMTPAEHDRDSAVSLSLVHYLGRTLAEMGVKSQQVTTTGFERLLKIYEMVINDSWELFRDMQNFNPYASDVRQQFRDMAEKIEDRIREAEENRQEAEERRQESEDRSQKPEERRKKGKKGRG